jgi:hypothetical protein
MGVVETLKMAFALFTQNQTTNSWDQQAGEQLSSLCFTCDDCKQK